MPLERIRSRTHRGAATAYVSMRETDDGINDHNSSSVVTDADDVSLSSSTYHQRLQSGGIVQVYPSALSPQKGKGPTKSTIYFLAILLTSIVPLFGMAAWLIIVKVHQGGLIFTGFTSAKIGGHLTQTQAKAIDFGCSALLAPLVMAGLNFTWFSCARVCVVNELDATHRGSKGVPLQSLARASRTSVGTYDLLGLWELFNAKTWRLSVLGAVALLSAITSSALSNIIAYESFREHGPSTVDHNLRMLSDYKIHSDNSHVGGTDPLHADSDYLVWIPTHVNTYYNFDPTQVSLQVF